MIIGKIAIMDKGLIQADKGMCPGRMPNSSLGGITLVSYPDMRLEIVKFVVLDHLLGIANYLEDEKVAAVGKYKGPLAPIGIIVGLVDFEAVLVDKLILGLAHSHLCHAVLGHECGKNLLLHPHKKPKDLWRPNPQTPGYPCNRLYGGYVQRNGH